MNKASARAAIILATGLLVCLAAPSQVAAAQDNAAAGARPDSSAGAPIALGKYTRQHRHYAHRGSGKAAKSAAKKDPGEAADNNTADNSNAIPSQVASANAQLAAADTPAGAAGQQPAKASDTPTNLPGGDGQVVAADQLNDVDRALPQAAAPATPAVAQAPADAPAATDAPAPVMAASSSDSSSWDRTSLIGKVFIAFGALLTVASATRLFMA